MSTTTEVDLDETAAADLGDAAASALDNVGQDFGLEQPALIPEGPEVKFVGVKFIAPDADTTYEIREELTFIVRVKIVDKGKALDKNDREHDYVKAQVVAINPQ